MKSKIIPTVFAIKKDDFSHRLERLAKVSRELHIDFMDGKFVKNKFMDLDIIPDLKKYKKNYFEAHLMIREPNKLIKKLEEKGFKKIIIHFEAYFNKKELQNCAKLIKKENMGAFLAVNPDTKASDYLNLLKNFDGIMFMGVHPGKEHQTFIYSVLDHIKELRHFNKKILIQIDGGINAGNINYIKKSGVNLFNSGSYVSESEDPKKAIKKLKDELK